MSLKHFSTIKLSLVLYKKLLLIPGLQKDQMNILNFK